MKQKKIKGLLEEEYFKAYYEANKDKIAEKGKAYREANKDKIAEKGKAYYEANKDKIAERFRNTHINIPLLGGRGGKSRMYTNGVTKEIKEQLPKIVNDVLEDCMKNPKKYLDESGENTLPSATLRGVKFQHQRK